MAKITVNVDTETRVLEVLVDGETQSNVQEVNFYLYDDYYTGRGEKMLSSRITLAEKDDSSGITKITYLMAKDCKEGRNALATGAKINKKNPDLVEVEDANKVTQDILEYFSRL